MAAARYCLSRLRVGAGPAISRWSERKVKAAGRMQRRWTAGGAFTAGAAVAAARFDSWTAATAPAPADPSDQKYAYPFHCTRLG